MKTIEETRVGIAELLEGKDQYERNKLGQYATPPSLAREIVKVALTHHSKKTPLRFMEPGFGTGAFYSALSQATPKSQIQRAIGVEIDDEVWNATEQLWSDSDVEIIHGDFTVLQPPTQDNEKATLLICNPPYVRHHHISANDKTRLKEEAQRLGFSVSGLSGLYIYFLLFSQQWLAHGAISAWLIPTEFLDVNYGKVVRDFLANEVELIRLHRFDSDAVQFDGALVSSAVVIFRNVRPTGDQQSEFTEGGTLLHPTVKRDVPLAQLQQLVKWSVDRAEVFTVEKQIRISDLFSIKRGIATGDNDFFLLSKDAIREHHIPTQFLRPILPSPRDLKDDEVLANTAGEPVLDEPRYLLDCKLTEEEICKKHPELWRYLEKGKTREIHLGYLCRSRKQWFWQEQRARAPFFCTYINRVKGDRLFRFIRNDSSATVANTYLILYPKPPLYDAFLKDAGLRKSFWHVLQSISIEDLKRAGRVYGGGLYKLEPKELANVPLPMAEMGAKMRRIVENALSADQPVLFPQTGTRSRRVTFGARKV